MLNDPCALKYFLNVIRLQLPVLLTQTQLRLPLAILALTFYIIKQRPFRRLLLVLLLYYFIVHPSSRRQFIGVRTHNLCEILFLVWILDLHVIQILRVTLNILFHQCWLEYFVLHVAAGRSDLWLDRPTNSTIILSSKRVWTLPKFLIACSSLVPIRSSIWINFIVIEWLNRNVLDSVVSLRMESNYRL